LIVFQKSLLNKYEPAVVTYVYYSIGLIFTLLLCLIFHSQFTLKDFNFNGEKLPWLAVAYATLFTTLFALNVNSWSGKRLPPSVSTVYNTLQPVGTVILSYFLLNSVPNSSEWFGGIVASIGLIVTMYAR
jgi:drug/metabolite transporter (DMT)-like permease